MGNMKILLFIAIIGAASSSHSGWNSSPNTQYHIQTDEGPERYFKYQTQSGQYRKEKRLQDGTVIGSYGWIDADGYLRLRDYIADNQGYRILKSKTVFVGQDRPIDDAVKSTKYVPPQSGILVDPSKGPPRPVNAIPARGVLAPVTPKPTILAYIPPSSTPQAYIPPSSTAQAYLPPSSTPVAYLPPFSTPQTYLGPSSTPNVYISHNSIESSTENPRFDFRPTVAPVAAVPSSSVYADSSIETSTAGYGFSSTESSTSDYGFSSTVSPIRAYESSSLPPIVAITSNALGDYRRRFSQAVSSTARPYYETSSHYDDSGYSANSLNLDPYSLQNTPIDRTDQYNYNNYKSRGSYKYQTTNPSGYTSNQIGNGYDPQYELYDGVSVTKNGFRYYLPRQYHEEENSGGSTRSGSFGYVDPFGIRRVIYYNTSPGSGFQHRKNNRYVGFNATPYDPRPL